MDFVIVLYSGRWYDRPKSFSEISSNKIFGQKIFSKIENFDCVIDLYSDRWCDNLSFSEISSNKIFGPNYFSAKDNFIGSDISIKSLKRKT